MRLHRISIALAVALMAAGCGTSSGSHSSGLKEIVYVNPLVGDGLWDLWGNCMQDEGKKLGIKIHIVGPPGDKVDAIAMQDEMSQAIANHARGIVTWSGGAPAAMDVLFKKAHDGGAVIGTLASVGVTHNQTIEFGSPSVDSDAAILAAIAARPGHQNVGVLTQREGYESLGHVERLRSQAAQYPNVTIVDQRFDYGVFADDLDLTAAMLRDHPEINAVANYNTFAGVFTAVRELHLEGKVAVFTGYEPGHPQPVLDAIRDGILGGVAVGDRCLTGRHVVDALDDAYRGKPYRAQDDTGHSTWRTPDEFKQLAAAGKTT